MKQQLIFHQQSITSSHPALRPQPIHDKPNAEEVLIGSQETIISQEQVVDEDPVGREEPTSDQDDGVDQQLIVVQQEHVEEGEHVGDQDVEMRESPLVKQVPVVLPGPCGVSEIAVTHNQVTGEENVIDDMSFILQQTGQEHDVSMSQDNDVAQASPPASVEPKFSALTDPNIQQPFRFHFSVPKPGSWMTQGPRSTSQAPFTFALPPFALSASEDTSPDSHGKNDITMTPAPNQSSVGVQDKDPSLEQDERRDLDMGSNSESNSLISELEYAMTGAEAEERSLGMVSKRDTTGKVGNLDLPAPMASDGSTIDPVSGSHSARSPDASGTNTLTFSGARHLLPMPRRMRDRLPRDQIEAMMSEAIEGLPHPSHTHFSSEYLAQLRAQMVDFSTMKKLFGDEVFDDDDWIPKMQQQDLQQSEVDLCDMSEETRYAVPPYTHHMMEQMMESLFIACIWDSAADEFDFDEDEEEKYLDDFMKIVKEYLRTHPADKSVVG